MTDLDDLRDELVRLGRRPVPAPRHDFVDGLLTRLVGEAQAEGGRPLPAPTPLRPAAPRRFASPRLLAGGSIAAALLLAVGLLSVLTLGQGGGGDGTATVASPSSFVGQLASSADGTAATVVTSTTVASPVLVTLRDETVKGGDRVRLAWDTFAGAGDVTYVVLRSAGDVVTEHRLTTTSYEEAVPERETTLRYRLEVRDADGVVLATSSTEVQITVKAS